MHAIRKSHNSEIALRNVSHLVTFSQFFLEAKKKHRWQKSPKIYASLLYDSNLLYNTLTNQRLNPMHEQPEHNNAVIQMHTVSDHIVLTPFQTVINANSVRQSLVTPKTLHFLLPSCFEI